MNNLLDSEHLLRQSISKIYRVDSHAKDEKTAVPSHRSASRIDSPSPDYYYSGDLALVTGFSASETVQFELLGVHPASFQFVVWGPGWLRHEVDELAAFLAAEPEYRQWMMALLDEPARVGSNGPSVVALK